MSIYTHIFAVAVYGSAAWYLGPRAATLAGLTGEPDSAFSLIAVLGCALVHEVLARHGAMAQFARSLRRARRFKQMVLAELDQARSDMAALRRQIEGPERRRHERLVDEMQVVKALLGQLAERVQVRRMPQPGRGAAPAAEHAGDTATAAPPADLLGAVQQALEGNRIDLYLQPVVSLPQRKVRYYEAFSRIRDGEGAVLAPEHYLQIAERHGLITTIDNLLLFRCVQLIRQLRRRNRTAAFFVNMSALTLADEDFFQQFAEFLELNADLADSLLFEFTQSDIASLAPAGERALARLAELGFRLSLDQVMSLDVDYAGLARRGFRFVKVDAGMLLSQAHQAEASLHVEDLKPALGRFGIDLIAEKIESEQVLVNLLDLDVDFGQGWLFGEPRRSREAL